MKKFKKQQTGGQSNIQKFIEMIKNFYYSVKQWLIDKTIFFQQYIFNKSSNPQNSINAYIIQNPGYFTKFILYIALLSIFHLLPLAIFILTIIYFIHILNVSKWFRTPQYYGDDIAYQDIDNIHSFLWFHINDYILYLLIICIIYVFMLISMFFINMSKSFIDKTNMNYRSSMNTGYVLFGIAFAVIIVHLLLFGKHTHSLSLSKNYIMDSIHNHINFDYIDFISKETDEKCEKCKMIIPGTGKTIYICECENKMLEVNNILNLQKYIQQLLIEVESKAAPADITLITVDKFKTYLREETTYKKDTQMSYYDLIVDAILTFSLIANFKNTEYKINLNRAFFENRTSILASINVSNSKIYQLDSNCMKNNDVDGKNNKSNYMLSICKTCDEIVSDIESSTRKLKDTVGDQFWSPQNFAIIVMLIVCIIYYMSQFSDFFGQYQRQMQQQQMMQQQMMQQQMMQQQ